MYFLILFHCNSLLSIWFNGNTTTVSKNLKKLLQGLAKIKQISKSDLHKFLQEDHIAFSVLSVSTKHIESTNCLSVTLSKNSAQSFYLGKTTKQVTTTAPTSLNTPPNDCLQDAQNCAYFAFFNSKEKKLQDLETPEQKQPATDNDKQPFQAIPWLVAGAVLLVLLVIYVVFARRKSKH